MTSNQSKLLLKTQTVGPWQTNTYALICPATMQSVLIDPAAQAETLLEMLAGSDPIAILLTHSHPDHTGALHELHTRLNVPVMAHPGRHRGRNAQAADRWLDHGNLVEVGEHTLAVHHTPGHTDDSICFGIGDDTRIIVGDAIFEGGPGHTSSSDDLQTTLQTLRNIILPWPDDTICSPGHGVSFRLGDQRAAIEGFLRKDHGDFFGDATWDM